MMFFTQAGNHTEGINGSAAGCTQGSHNAKRDIAMLQVMLYLFFKYICIHGKGIVNRYFYQIIMANARNPYSFIN